MNSIRELTIGATDSLSLATDAHQSGTLGEGVDDPHKTVEGNPGSDGAGARGIGGGRPEYGIFWCCSAALLMLRLVCPALICPVGWGFLRVRDERERAVDKSGTSKRSSTSAGTSKAIAIDVDASSDSEQGGASAYQSASLSPSTYISPIANMLDRATGKPGGVAFAAPTPSVPPSSNALTLDRAVPALIVIGHSLLDASPMLLTGTPRAIAWGGTDTELRALLDAAEEVVSLIPIQKVRRMEGRA